MDGRKEKLTSRDERAFRRVLGLLPGPGGESSYNE